MWRNESHAIIGVDRHQAVDKFTTVTRWARKPEQKHQLPHHISYDYTSRSFHWCEWRSCASLHSAHRRQHTVRCVYPWTAIYSEQGCTSKPLPSADRSWQSPDPRGSSLAHRILTRLCHAAAVETMSARFARADQSSIEVRV
jgi:hypothetical protein